MIFDPTRKALTFCLSALHSHTACRPMPEAVVVVAALWSRVRFSIILYLPFSKFTCIFNRIFPGLWVKFLVLLSSIRYKKYEELPLACLFEVFTGLRLSTPTFCIKVMIMLNILSVYWFY